MSWGAGAGLAATVIISVGCMSPKGVTPNAAEAPEAPVPPRWTPEPVAMRVFPTTRFVAGDTGEGGAGGEALLEAAVELFDPMGDSLKASGVVRFELYTTGQTPGVAADQLLYSWDIALNTLDDQQRFYDPIIRGYVFRLRVQSPEIVRWRTLLRAGWQPVDGDRLSDELELRTAW